MKRLAATCAADVRLQYRNGFYAAMIPVLVCSAWLLRALPAAVAEELIPPVLLGNLLINTFYFMSGLVLLERVEGTLLSQSTTPLRVSEYIASKIITLTMLSLIEASLLIIVVRGADVSLVSALVGVSLAAVLFCLAGLIMVTRFPTINEFLLPSIPVATVLCLPVFNIFGIGSEPWYWLHPIQGPMTLMWANAEGSLGNILYAAIYGLFWSAPMYRWGCTALEQTRAGS